MKLYNTLSRHKEDFKPINTGVVKMYSCGPTVYNFAHVGNMRAYIFMDLLRRALKLEGYKLLGVMNITDVGHLLSDEDEGEDKMVKAAREQKKTPWQIAEEITKVFLEDLRSLNVEMPEYIPKATDHIQEMIDYVKVLVDRGYAYIIPDGVYFDTSKFADYGKLSGQKNEEKLAGARIKINEQKKSPDDFALWKTAEKEHIMQWPSPWGIGYPGWHIECSAMGEKYLGEIFDIHTGGIEHVPVHHENEIAQSEAKTGKKTVNYWLHGEFLLMNGGKMSKSLGNTYTLKQLEEKGYAPLDFRYFCLNAHYRQKLNFTFEGLTAAKTALARLREQTAQHRDSTDDVPADVLDGYKQEFLNAVNDDLNIPAALGVLWKLVKEKKSKKVYDLIVYTDKIFGLKLDEAQSPAETAPAEISAEVQSLLDARKLARQNKDFKESDRLRDEIARLGFKVLDTKEGQSVEKI